MSSIIQHPPDAPAHPPILDSSAASALPDPSERIINRHPRTPSFDSAINSTPAFSSPDTPHDAPGANRAIGVGSGRKRDSMDFAGMDTEDEEVDEGDVTVTGGIGLGYGIVERQQAAGTSGDADVDMGADEQERRRAQELGIGGSGSSKHASPKTLPAASLVDQDMATTEEPEALDMDGLRTLRSRLDALSSSEDDGQSATNEAVDIARRLLGPLMNDLPFLRDQVETQKETIRTLQEQAKLSKQLMQIERDRHVAERAGFRAEIQALERVRERDIASGKRPSKVLDLDVGYHLELEAANKRLEMDNRLMAPRLADTQRQIDKLVTELRHLRSHVILSTDALASNRSKRAAGPEMSAATHTGQQISPSKIASIHASMGDARTEHLLLASRKLRSMRAKDDKIGRITLDELQRGGVVGPEGGIGYAEGYGEVIGGSADEEDADISDEEEIKPFNRRGSVSNRGKTGATPLLPRAKRSNKRSLPPPTTPRSKAARPQPLTTPGTGNFDDLLRAAEMATRPGTPTPPASAVLLGQMPFSAMSATRSTTTRGREPGGSGSERGSPVKRPRRDGPGGGAAAAWAGDVFDEEDESSALDLLAQASQLDVARSDAPDMEGPDLLSGSQGSLGPAIDLRATPTGASQQYQQQHLPQQQIDPALSGDLSRRSSGPGPTATPQSRPRALSNASMTELHTPSRKYDAYEDTPMTLRSPPSSLPRDMHDPPPGAYASPTGATVPGLGKYVHLTNNMPARRIRSPYLKWTNEEDELLARAVAEHGEKWDMVSKGVPTRSYHQVRQRWLRKTGAFDKKPQVDTSVEKGVDEDDDGSPTPTPGGGTKTPGGKKRKASQGLLK